MPLPTQTRSAQAIHLDETLVQYPLTREPQGDVLASGV